MKKLLIIVSSLCLLLLGACSNGSSDEAKAKQSSGKTQVIFWHAMSGDLEKTLNQIVKKYNASQDKVEVKPVFQGTYEEALTKFNTVAGTKDAPTIMQTFEVGTKYMMNTHKIQPIQKFIDQDHYDTSVWEKNIANYYKVGDKQYSMPFNSSSPVLVYNKDAFKKAGLDPNKPPKTYSELKETARKLTQKDGKRTTQYGFSILNYGWFFEELLANQGGLYVNKGNGRDGNATKATFAGEKGQRVFNLIHDMYKEGTFYNAGQNWDDMRAAFQSGKMSMFLDSSAGIRALVDNSPFEVGVADLPVPDGVKNQGVVMGGASLWMSKGEGISTKEQKAAWDFMKYLSTPKVQAKWHVESGYFATNPKAYNDPMVQKEWKKYPQLKKTVDLLHQTKSTKATQGALISVFPQSRQNVVTAMESIYQGMDPIEVLKQAQEGTNFALESANR
ncbi:ABC transporter substrate-binding protein [Priestia koreensis]|uniref:ABC transporter substrate-binding protein n=1 Tax=Priestia koreensis TaxID=284581 RepID=UPI001F57D94D|nr:ABC transporter substrate-binding protein [Priestia koreensis]UNL85353.1 ABC transporter substrate-binding protein [Priestia koreensis]